MNKYSLVFLAALAAPLAAPARYGDLYQRDRLPPLVNAFRPLQAPWFALGSNAEFRGYDGAPAGRAPDEMAAALRHGYAAAVSFVDAQVGRVLNAVDSLGLAENTIVVLGSDHGFKLSEHDAWGKSTNVDLDQDPAENRNVAYEPAYQRTVRKLSQRLDQGWKAAQPK